MKKIFLGFVLLGLTQVSCSTIKAKEVDNIVKQDDVQKPKPGLYTKIGDELPVFRIKKQDGTIIKKEELMNDKKTFLILFNPTCGSCIQLGQTFKKHEKDFKKFNVVFVVANGMESYLDYYFEETALNSISHYYIGVDEANLAIDANIRDGMPQINIYKPGLVLEKIYTGNVPFDYLQKHF
ncbi:MAG TPA: hypothetical protein VK027_08200 [Chitinophagaceae bacterium]|nr:hypothetical protein [Chitinophagaceae bacterium]